MNDEHQHDEQPAVPDVGLSAGELWDEQNEEAAQRLDQLAATVTQREWLLITRQLDRTRQEIGADSGLTLLALAWAKQKHETGGASWDKLLDLTDAQLEALHGFPAGTREDAERRAAEAAQSG